MITPKYYKSNESKTINSSKNFKRPHLDISESSSSNSTEKNRILKFINEEHLKRINISKINNRITEPNKIIFSNSRLRNLQILSNDSSLNRLGKSTLDVNKIFGIKNIKKVQENDEISKIPNQKLITFKNEYILKFAKNAEFFDTFEKNMELIAENKRENFNEIFVKIKRLLKHQTNIFFDYKIKNKKEEVSKLEPEDINSGFYKYKSHQKLELPKLFPTLQNEEINDKSMIDKNNTNDDNIIDESLNLKNKEVIFGWYQLCSLINKFLFIIFNELKESKYTEKKLNQKLKDYEIRLGNNSKDIENMRTFLNKYEVNSKIYLKLKNEKEIEKIKSIFNKRENEYKLSNYRLKSEIQNLTYLLDENKKYYNNCKELEKEIELRKKKNEELKSFYNQEIQEKNMENIIKSENEEELLLKIKALENKIEEFKNERDEYKKKDIENEIKIKNLYMNINEKNENILMQNEEVEWFIREYNKLNNNYLDTKADLRNIENLLTKLKEKEKANDIKKEGNKQENSKNGENLENKEGGKDKDNEKSEEEKSFLEDMFKM